MSEMSTSLTRGLFSDHILFFMYMFRMEEETTYSCRPVLMLHRVVPWTDEPYTRTDYTTLDTKIKRGRRERREGSPLVRRERELRQSVS